MNSGYQAVCMMLKKDADVNDGTERGTECGDRDTVMPPPHAKIKGAPPVREVDVKMQGTGLTRGTVVGCRVLEVKGERCSRK